MKPHRSFLLIAVAVSNFLLLNASPSQAQEKTSDRILTVSTLPLQKTEGYESKRQFTGQVEPRRRSSLGFERVGRIVELVVDRGDEVAEGQLIARLDTSSLVASRKKLEADLVAANAVLKEAKEGPRKESIDAARSSLEEQQSQFELAITNFQRRERLLQKNLISKEEYDQAYAAKQRWEALVDGANHRLDELLAGTRTEKIEAQVAQVAAIQAAIDQVDVEIAKSKLYSPYRGTILVRDIDEGSVVAPGQTVLSIVEDKVLEAKIGVAHGVIQSIEKGKVVDVECNGEKMQGIVRAIMSERDTATRTQAVILRLQEDAWKKTIPGDVARVTLHLNQSAPGYWVPTESLIAGSRGLWNCFVVENVDADGIGKATLRVVELVHSEGDRSLISGNLSEGDLLVAAAPHRISSGQSVRIQARSDR